MNLSYIRKHATELHPSSCCLRKIREFTKVCIKGKRQLVGESVKALVGRIFLSIKRTEKKICAEC